MNILVTGGAGYIGSHTCVVLLEAGHSVVVVDNLVNSKVDTIEKIERITGKTVVFYEEECTDSIAMDDIFKRHSFDGVIHFAGLKAVGETVDIPLDYYYNNLVSTMVVCKACLKYNVEKFVFSSSATVYGENDVPFVESMKLYPTTNPYGETKAMIERILTDLSVSVPHFAVSILRYFNPAGAHESGLIGENPNDVPNNLMPYVTQVASGKRSELKVFGDDYNTIDGTGVRDYIHVLDLAEGHVAAIEKLTEGVHVYNLGTGRGTSVLEIVNAFEKVNNIKIPYTINDRRPGDIANCFADVSKAERELGWKPKRGIEDMVRDAWTYEKKQNK